MSSVFEGVKEKEWRRSEGEGVKKMEWRRRSEDLPPGKQTECVWKSKVEDALFVCRGHDEGWMLKDEGWMINEMW